MRAARRDAGRTIARRVFGDMGGADSRDHLAGIDRLVADGVADPRRLGVTGGSYGGFMSSWLITQDPRFAAAVVFAPITNWVSEQLTAHIARYCEIALAGQHRRSLESTLHPQPDPSCRQGTHANPEYLRSARQDHAARASARVSSRSAQTRDHLQSADLSPGRTRHPQDAGSDRLSHSPRRLVRQIHAVPVNPLEMYGVRKVAECARRAGMAAEVGFERRRNPVDRRVSERISAALQP